MTSAQPGWDLSEAAVNSWRLLSDRVAAELDPRLRANLAIVERHLAAEVAGDLDALMATMIPQPEYEFFGQSMYGARQAGHAPVRAMYARANETGRNRREIEVRSVVVDASSVVTEVVLRQATRGSVLQASRPAASASLDPDRWYVTEDTAVIIWPITPHGLISGERVFLTDVDHVAGALEPGESPHLGPVPRV